MLLAGARLGPYEIVSQIGAGGMGEVYEATDTRLGRSVALKILPPELAQNPDRRLRFEREARTVSKLNHPHICTLHDIGEGYLVMELLQGETLAARLARGPLSLPEIVRYGSQIADALEKAHREGVVHRDLKPGNIMLTKSGAKLLDFGLAKIGGVVEVSPASPTAHQSLTEEGTIVGTFHYMAPEQVEGRPTDDRTDIFALGAILYEMATGRRAFEAETRAALISAILSKQPPPLSSVQPLAPRALEHVITKCLEKDPDGRWQSAHDVAAELRWIGETGAEIAEPKRRETRWRTVALLSVLAAAAIASLWVWRTSDRALVEPVHLMLRPPDRTVFASPYVRPFAISPDGKFIAFVTMGSPPAGPTALWFRPLSNPESTWVEGSNLGLFPFWSPDGRFLAFFQNAALKKVAISGGSPETICPAPRDAARGASWSLNGTILFANRDGLYAVSAEGGNPKRLLAATNGVIYSDPDFLPDGSHYLLTAFDPQRDASILVRSLDDSSERVLLRNASNAIWIESGHLLFVRGDVLMIQRFDLHRRRMTGDPVVLTKTVGVERRDSMSALFKVSRDGRFLAFQPSTSQAARLIRVNRTGQQVAEIAGPGLLFDPSLSHDGSRLAVSIEQTSGDADIWIIDLERGVKMRITAGPSNDASAVWSPDDQSLVYTAELDLYRVSVTGGSPELLLKSDLVKYASDWSPDGDWILFTEGPGGGRGDIKALRLSDRKVIPIVTTPFGEHTARFSPDGRWIAYQSRESETPEIYVQRFRDGAFKTRVSSDGGAQPNWSRDGKRIYYNAPYSVVDIRLGTPVQVSTPRRLFLRTPLTDTDPYCLLPDEQGFIGRARDELTQPYQIEILMNWAGRLP